MHPLGSLDVTRQRLLVLSAQISKLLTQDRNIIDVLKFNKTWSSLYEGQHNTRSYTNTCTYHSRSSRGRKDFIKEIKTNTTKPYCRSSNYRTRPKTISLSYSCQSRLNIGRKDCFREIHTYTGRTFCKSDYGYNEHRIGPKTIFSLSSGLGKSGVGVVRVSGPKVKDILRRMVPEGVRTPERKAVLCKILDPDNKQPIDKGLVLHFPGPRSFTGEDCLEFHVHGGPAVITRLLSSLHKIPDCMQAEPGEFTKRAFMNGKLDLTEVEGLGDLIHAETEAQRKQALRQMDGDLSRLYSRWRTAIIKCVADIEAFIDFSEDQQIEDGIVDKVTEMVHQLKAEIRGHVEDKRQGERLREGVYVTILGEPNVGKSSLLNIICQRPVAIVTEIAGTTRDIIETAINLDGYPVLMSDTAGLRETQDIVEKEGVVRAVKRARNSDIRIFMFDSIKHLYDQDKNVTKQGLRRQKLMNNIQKDDHKRSNEKNDMDYEVTNDQDHPTNKIADHFEEFELESDNTIVVLNKIDLLPSDIVASLKDDFDWFGYISASGDGVVLTTMKTEEKNTHHVAFSSETNKDDTVKDSTLNLRTNKTEHAFSLDTSLEKNNFDIIKDFTLKTRSIQAEGTKDVGSSSRTIKPVFEKGKTLGCDCSGSNNNNNNPTNGGDINVVAVSEEGIPVCGISCLTGQGLEDFIHVLREKVAKMCGNPLSGHPSITQTRHRSHLNKCLENLDQYEHMITENDIVLASEYLRCALREIGKITGNISSEEILDVIFKDFCIGK